MIEIINELNLDNGSNYKMDVLRKHKDNELLKKVLKMTYDKVAYTYGISMKNIDNLEVGTIANETLEWGVNQLKFLVTREVTGNAGRELLETVLARVSLDDAKIVEGIINRDLRINMGRSNINKVFKNLIVKPPYMRCNTYNEKTQKKISFPALVQIKADGMAMFVSITSEEVICITRSGEEFMLESLQHLSKNENLVGNIIQGEFLIRGEDNRANGNGLLNSLIKYKQSINNSLSELEAEKIENDIVFQVWDLIPMTEYSRGKDKLGKTKYIDRFNNLVGALRA